MGGRGSVSASYNNKTVQINIGDAGGGGNFKIIDATPDSRTDIQKMFVDELGADLIGGTQSMNTAALGAVGIQLKNLEKQYGAISASPGFEVVAVGDPGVKGAVGVDIISGSQTLFINPGYMGNITKYNKGLASEQKSGFKMPTDGSVKNQARYTITHEYGHMLQNAMYQKAKANGYQGTSGEYARSVASEISKNAVSRYGGTQKSLSSYGAKNSAEFFAEAFANANLGNPNSIGKAMNDYLKKNRL